MSYCHVTSCLLMQDVQLPVGVLYCSGLTTNLGRYSNSEEIIGKILSTKVILSRLPPLSKLKQPFECYTKVL